MFDLFFILILNGQWFVLDDLDVFTFETRAECDEIGAQVVEELRLEIPQQFTWMCEERGNDDNSS